jgi:hypothetical protein
MDFTDVPITDSILSSKTGLLEHMAHVLDEADVPSRDVTVECGLLKEIAHVVYLRDVNPVQRAFTAVNRNTFSDSLIQFSQTIDTIVSIRKTADVKRRLDGMLDHQVYLIKHFSPDVHLTYI